MEGPFIVVWKGNEDYYLVTEIFKLKDSKPDTIVSAAAEREGYTEEDIEELLSMVMI